MSTDPLDLVDPIRLLLLLLPERWRAPVGALISLAAASQGIAAGVVSRLPLSAREHPRWGWLARALGWWSVLRFRDEKGTTKLPGGDTAPRVTLAPLDAQPASLVTLAAVQGAVALTETREHPTPDGFDPAARQPIAPAVVAAAQRASAHVGAVPASAFAAPSLLPLPPDPSPSTPAKEPT